MSAPTPVAYEAILPGRPWSLWDMINSQVFGLCHHIAHLHGLEDAYRARHEILQNPELRNIAVGSLGMPGMAVTENDRKQIEGYLAYSRQLANQFL